MNIFMLDENMDENVKCYTDKHVVKQILEYCQMLMGAYYYSPPHIKILKKLKSNGLYTLTHKNHPCTIWTRYSNENFEYLFILAAKLNREMYHRFKTKDNHKSLSILAKIIEKFELPELNNSLISKLTQPPVCMPDNCKIYTDIYNIQEINNILSYRNYYNKEKRHLFKWTNRPVPSWIT